MGLEYMDAQDCSLSLEELEQMDQADYILVDIREERAYQHGFIPGAIHMDPEALEAGECSLSKDKKIVLYCLKGVISEDAAFQLTQKGYSAYSFIRRLWRLADPYHEKGRERIGPLRRD